MSIPAADVPNTKERVVVDVEVLGESILCHLAEALHNAASRLRQAASGQSTFASDADLHASLALLRLAPTLLPLISRTARENKRQRSSK